MVYHSKKDWWLITLVWSGIPLLLIVGVISIVFPGGDARFGWTFLFISAFTAALILLMTYPLYYEITASKLIVRCGVLVRKEIPLSDIVEAKSSTNPASAPGWSLDRVQIDYRKDGRDARVLISPTDKLKFLQELAANEPTLELRGECLIRT